MIMKISWIKSENDDKSFKLVERLGMDVYAIPNLEDVDIKLKQLVQEKYDTIILSNEVANFSQDIITKYQKEKDIKIIISP